MSKKIKIIIADDHNLVRQSMALALATDPSLVVVGQAENGKELIGMIGQNQPDVILLDLQMPVMDGWETLDHIKKHYNDCKVVVVSMHFEGVLIRDLVAKGAHGFLPKNSDFETLISAIHEV